MDNETIAKAFDQAAHDAIAGASKNGERYYLAAFLAYGLVSSAVRGGLPVKKTIMLAAEYHKNQADMRRWRKEAKKLLGSLK